jgi:hypothetical protein
MFPQSFTTQAKSRVTMKVHMAEVNPEKQDKLYKAEYIGSGTFIISKPKRKKIKMRQSQLKNPKRGSRK